jgi:hypothetical protein
MLYAIFLVLFVVIFKIVLHHRMKYFTIGFSTEKSIVGNEYPQIQTMGGLVNKFENNSVYKVFSDAFPEFSPNLDYFILHPNARISDVLSTSMISYGLIVHKRVQEILIRHRLPEHRFYPAVIKHENKLYDDYLWFFIFQMC